MPQRACPRFQFRTISHNTPSELPSLFCTHIVWTIGSLQPNHSPNHSNLLTANPDCKFTYHSLVDFHLRNHGISYCFRSHKGHTQDFNLQPFRTTPPSELPPHVLHPYCVKNDFVQRIRRDALVHLTQTYTKRMLRGEMPSPPLEDGAFWHLDWPLSVHLECLRTSFSMSPAFLPSQTG